jgi:hypothetical protein
MCSTSGTQNRGEQVHAKELRQFARVDRISLGPCLSDELHVKGVRRVRADTDELQLPHEPFPIQRRFHRHGDGRWQCGEPVLDTGDRSRTLKNDGTATQPKACAAIHSAIAARTARCTALNTLTNTARCVIDALNCRDDAD